LSEKVLPPEEKHSDFSVINGHREIFPGQISVSLGMNLQRVLLKSTEKPYLSEKLFKSLTFIQTKRIKSFPVILIDSRYWNLNSDIRIEKNLNFLKKSHI
jgi:hypothetical protein